MPDALDAPFEGSTPSTVLDWRHLREITGGDEEFVGALLAEYRCSALSTLERLDEAISAADRVGLKSAAHSLKGSSRTIGATGIASASEALERLAADGSPADWLQAHRQVLQEWTKFQQTAPLSD